MILDALHKIANHGSSLTRDQARDVMAEILRGEATDAQIGALLVALHMKGETVEEIVGFAQAIRAAATPLHSEDGQALDVSGTGRDALVDTPRAPSTSPPPLPSLPPERACASPSTAIAASRRNAAQPM